MNLLAIGLERADEWDAIVRSFEKYDVYWLSGYVKAFKIHGDGEPLLLYYYDSDVRGINVEMKRDVADDDKFRDYLQKGIYYDFATPYGYGGWLIEGEKTENLFKAYDTWAKDNGIISEFVRFHPLIRNHEVCRAFYSVVQLGEVVHMDLFSPEDVWKNLSSKNRNCIRKAMKSGVKIYNGRFPEIYEKFIQIYNSTMDKVGAESYYYFKPVFYSSILDNLPQNAQVFWAEKDEAIIAASIIIGAKGFLNYHLSGSIKEFNSLAPLNYLLYEVALWGSANGFSSFYLGGGVGSREDSLFAFKRAFYKGALNHFYIGKRIYDQKKYDELVRLGNVANEDWFPAYRG
ncbi:MAG: peptidoglycan bridge formation glycyltransferase FemA/FemB family protein [Spirochaetales bacterium]|nr:peptidoglycan bridge formation glycyltransferase FemA/FemB family protein [Spirochaetales bacterium]